MKILKADDCDSLYVKVGSFPNDNAISRSIFAIIKLFFRRAY